MTIGSSPRRVADGVREADWSPDGESLAVVRDLGNGRDRLEYPIGHQLFEASGYLSDPRVSPDGQRVAVFEHPWRFDDRGWIKVIDRAGRATTVEGEFWEVEGLAWTPDGARLLFSAAVAGGFTLQPTSVPAVATCGRGHGAMGGEDPDDGAAFGVAAHRAGDCISGL